MLVDTYLNLAWKFEQRLQLVVSLTRCLPAASGFLLDRPSPATIYTRLSRSRETLLHSGDSFDEFRGKVCVCGPVAEGNADVLHCPKSCSFAAHLSRSNLAPANLDLLKQSADVFLNTTFTRPLIPSPQTQTMAKTTVRSVNGKD